MDSLGTTNSTHTHTVNMQDRYAPVYKALQCQFKKVKVGLGLS